MSYKTGFYEGRLGIGLSSTMGMGDGNPRYPLDINGDIRLTGSIVNGDGQVLSLVPTESLWTIGNSNLSYTGGNVGIGTTSPSDFLTVRHGTSSGSTYRGIALEENDGTLRWRTALTGANGSNHCYQYMVNASGTTTVQIHADGNSYFNAGNVGIGTTTPQSGLDIHKSHPLTGLMESDGITFSTEAVGSPNWGLGYIGGYHKANNGSASGFPGGIIFKTKPANSTADYNFNDSMVIDAAGNVGIGTTEPKAKLHVEGGHLLITEGEKSKDETGGCIQFHSVENGSDTAMWGQDYAHSLIADVKYGSGGYNENSEMMFYKGNNADGSYGPDRFHFIGTGDFRITLGGTSDATGKHGHEVARHHSSWANGQTPKFIVKSSGNVGIGTTSPDGLLDIEGNTNSGVRTYHKNLSTGTSSYVEKTFKAGDNELRIGVSADSYSDSNWNNAWLYSLHKNLKLTTAYDMIFCAGGASTERMRITSIGRIEQTITDSYLQSWNRSGHSQWWAHIESSYFTIHRNGVGHCGRFYASTNENGLVFNRACRANYTQYYTNYGGWNAGLLCGAGPMGGSSPLNWTASYACVFTTNGNLHLDNKSGYTTYINYYSSGNIHLCSAGGKVTIGGTTASAPLHVHGYASDSGQAYWISRSDGWWGNNQNYTVNFGAQIDYGLWVGGRLGVASDRRIKENIVDVPDHDALEMLRNIPCRYYEYKDKVSRGIDKTIGFIAQEVREKMPMAVSLQKSLIPNEMRKLENISWEEITDNSTKRYKLTSDLSDCNGIIYRFFVSNEPSGNDECKKEIIGNQDDTFTFEKKWNNVFCYGKEVDDFHVLDKQKLFALNFSATQELDRKVIALENENAELKTKVNTLESELAAIKQHLGI